MKRKIHRGATSQILRLSLLNTNGTDATGLVYNSTGLVAYYLRDGDAAATAITLVSGTVGTWSSGGFSEVTNMSGTYELGLPNAALASGNEVIVQVYGVSGLMTCRAELELDAVNYQDSQFFGLSLLQDVWSYIRGKFTNNKTTGQITYVDTDNVTTRFTTTIIRDNTGTITSRLSS